MTTRTKILAVIVLAVFVLLFVAAGTQSQNPDDVASLIVAIVIIAASSVYCLYSNAINGARADYSPGR